MRYLPSMIWPVCKAIMKSSPGGNWAILTCGLFLGRVEGRNGYREVIFFCRFGNTVASRAACGPK